MFFVVNAFIKWEDLARRKYDYVYGEIAFDKKLAIRPGAVNVSARSAIVTRRRIRIVIAARIAATFDATAHQRENKNQTTASATSARRFFLRYRSFLQIFV